MLVLFVAEVVYKQGYDLESSHLFTWCFFFFYLLVLPPISTEGVAEDSADIEKLANKCRDQMLATLKEITPARQIKNKSQ